MYIAEVIVKDSYTCFGEWCGYDTKEVEIQANSEEEAKVKAQAYTTYKNGVRWVKTKQEVEAEKMLEQQRLEEAKIKEQKTKEKQQERILKKALEMGLTVEEYKRNERRKAELRKIERERIALLKQLKELDERQNYLKQVIK
jgi:hypothetical protein